MTRQGDCSLYSTDRIQVGSTVINDDMRNGTAIGDTIFTLCHGLGPDRNGSDAASSTVSNIFANTESATSKDDIIRDCIKSNDVVHLIQNFGNEYANIATTLSGISFRKDKYIIFNVGNNDVYRYEDGTLVSEFWENNTTAQKEDDELKQHIGAFGRDSWPLVKSGSLFFKNTYFIIMSSTYSKLFSRNEIDEAIKIYPSFGQFAEDCNRIAVMRNREDDLSSLFVQCRYD